MGLLKKSNSFSANSILESVIALSIISICLYIAIMVFSAVFTPKTSPKFYNSQNKANELFYLSQLQLDSIENEVENITVEREQLNGNLQKLNVIYKDSSNIKFNKSFYIIRNEE